MTLLKPLHSQHLLTTYEQSYIHSFHKNGKLISEQSPGSPNLLFDLTTRPSHPRATGPGVLKIPQWTHYLLTGLDSLPAATGMYFNLITHRTTPTYNNETTANNTPHNHTAHSQRPISE